MGGNISCKRTRPYQPTVLYANLKKSNRFCALTTISDKTPSCQTLRDRQKLSTEPTSVDLPYFSISSYSSRLIFIIFRPSCRVTSQSRTSPTCRFSSLTIFSGIVVLTEGDLVLAFATVDFSPMPIL